MISDRDRVLLSKKDKSGNRFSSLKTKPVAGVIFITFSYPEHNVYVTPSNLVQYIGRMMTYLKNDDGVASEMRQSDFFKTQKPRRKRKD